jgi:dipeptidyl aminopeptidase/acylaminoacyl peptidase
MLRRASAIVAIALLSASCGKDQNNPFSPLNASRAPSGGAVIAFVSGAWAADTGEPRELLAVNADGSTLERLTGCTQAAQPCDIVQFAFAPNRNQIAAVRSTPKAQDGASTLYFMDLARSVEKQLFSQKRASVVDWSADGSFLIYVSPGTTTSTVDDLWLCQKDGSQDQNLTNTTAIRERSARIDPSASTAVFERIDETGVGRIYLFQETPVTAGPATGPALPDTPFVVGGDADPAFSPTASELVFRRLTGIGNGGLGTWDLMTVKVDGSDLQTLVTGPAFRGAPDWSSRGVVFVETDAAANEPRLVVVQADGTGRSVLHKEAADFLMAAPRWIRGN